MTFYNLAIGQRFVFVDAEGNDAIRWGSMGPWFKLGAGKYARRADVSLGAAYTTSGNARVRVAKGQTVG